MAPSQFSSLFLCIPNYEETYIKANIFTYHIKFTQSFFITIKMASKKNPNDHD